MYECTALTKKYSKKDPLKAFGTKLHSIYIFHFILHFLPSFWNKIGFVFSLSLFFTIIKTLENNSHKTRPSRSAVAALNSKYTVSTKWREPNIKQIQFFFVSFYWAKRYENRRIIHPFALKSIVTSPHFIYEQQEQKTRNESKLKKKSIRKLNNESRKPIVTWFIVHTAR